MTPAPISVERFDPDIGWKLLDPVTETCRQVAVMEPFVEGEYVRHSDYAALLHQLAERDAEVGEIQRQHVLSMEAKHSAWQDAISRADMADARAEAAERAREEAINMLREVEPVLRKAGFISVPNAIAAFLAASGGEK